MEDNLLFSKSTDLRVNIMQKQLHRAGLVIQACNPSYLGD
jgi:hypothetical protein